MTPEQSAALVERVALALYNERQRFFDGPQVASLADLKAHQYRDQLRQARAALAACQPMVEGERERLRAALKPFAECVEQISDDESDEEWAKFRLLVGDYRRAADAVRALNTTKDQSDG